jgi:endonuclease III
VNLVTPALFKRYPTSEALAHAKASELERLIVSTGFFRQKSKALLGMAALVVERHNGEVPADMAALTALPGVGRKTANVVLGHALGVPGLPVDRHVLRVANRIGLAEGDDPVEVESQLCGVMPRARGPHLRRVDPARPARVPAETRMRALPASTRRLRLLRRRWSTARADARPKPSKARKAARR